MGLVRLTARQFPGLLLALALLLPSLGPLLDHHFAERQPGHLHIGVAGYHVHPHGYQHLHLHDSSGTGDAGKYPVAIYKNDTGAVAVPVIINADSAIDSFMGFEPSSLFLLPPPPEARLKQGYVSPPVKPPRSLL